MREWQVVARIHRDGRISFFGGNQEPWQRQSRPLVSAHGEDEKGAWWSVLESRERETLVGKVEWHAGDESPPVTPNTLRTDSKRNQISMRVASKVEQHEKLMNSCSKLLQKLSKEKLSKSKAERKDEDQSEEKPKRTEASFTGSGISHNESVSAWSEILEMAEQESQVCNAVDKEEQPADVKGEAKSKEHVLTGLRIGTEFDKVRARANSVAAAIADAHASLLPRRSEKNPPTGVLIKNKEQLISALEHLIEELVGEQAVLIQRMNELQTTLQSLGIGPGEKLREKQFGVINEIKRVRGLDEIGHAKESYFDALTRCKAKNSAMHKAREVYIDRLSEEEVILQLQNDTLRFIIRAFQEKVKRVSERLAALYTDVTTDF